MSDYKENIEEIQVEELVDTPVIEEIQAEELVNAPSVEETKTQEVASEFGIESSISEVEESKDNELISSPEKKYSVPSLPAMIVEQTGAIASNGANKKDKPSKKSALKADDTVAVHSTKNLHASGLKSIYKGFNILSTAHAEKWLEKRPNEIRLATPEEVAKAFGK